MARGRHVPRISWFAILQIVSNCFNQTVCRYCLVLFEGKLIDKLLLDDNLNADLDDFPLGAYRSIMIIHRCFMSNATCVYNDAPFS